MFQPESYTFGMEPFKPVTLDDLRRRRLDLWAWCNDCCHNRVLALAPLLARFGPGQTASGVAAWVRCSRCGSRRVETRPAYEGGGLVSNHHWQRPPGTGG